MPAKYGKQIMKPPFSIRSFRFCWVMASSISIHLLASGNLVLSVPATTDYVTVPDADPLDLTTRFTLEAWVNLAAETGADQTIVSKRRSTTGTGYALVVAKGKVVLEMNNDTGNGQGINFSVGSARAIEAGTWYHIAGTYDGGSATVFINGVKAAASPVQMTLLNSALPVTIGQQALPGDLRPLVGQIDEVRVWNTALTGEQILAGMDQRLTGREPNLVAYWNFDSGTANDLTPFGNNGTLVGQSRIVPGPAMFSEPERPSLIPDRFSKVGGFRFQLQAVNTSPTYQVEASTDLEHWSAVGFSVKLQAPGSVELIDPTATNYTTLRFYRALTTP